MPQPGDIVVERLTGRRAMVIQATDRELTCRFADGRLEDRFVFEVEPPPSLLMSLLSLVLAPFADRGRDNAPLGARVRPMIVRQPRPS
jgi:hypothetical protein